MLTLSELLFSFSIIEIIHVIVELYRGIERPSEYFDLHLKKKEMLTFILSTFIVLCLYFIVVYLRGIVFVNKHKTISSNTVKGFAFLLDMVLLNVINIIYWVVRGFTNDVVKDKLSVVVNRAFHGSGEGVGDLFVEVQTYLLMFYFVYSLVFELSGMRSTLLGYFFGLRVKFKNEGNRFVSILIRSLLKPVSLLLLPLTFAFSYSNKERKWLHDILAGTYVEMLD